MLLAANVVRIPGQVLSLDRDATTRQRWHMSEPTKPAAKIAADLRKQRQAAALRANLRRRKEQIRGLREAADNGESPTDGDRTD